MDLHTVTEVVSPAAPGMWRPGDAWLGGGTALFGESRPSISRLLDLPSAGWPPITVRDDGLEIAATCTIATLFQELSAYAVVGQCCHSFLASFKIWNVATVGGNLCAALPAGPMISLGAALGGVCTILGPSSSREIPVADFVTGEGRTVLRDGELLRSIFLPAAALGARTAFRRGSLHRHGRSSVLLIGLVEGHGGMRLAVTASTRSPWILRFPSMPAPASLAAALASIPSREYIDDVHGDAAWRAHLTRYYAEQIRTELSS